MITAPSLAALTPTRPLGGDTLPIRSVTPVPGTQRQDVGEPSQRTLETVPKQPIRPLPRGSLLDLKV